jgi:VCBS repeat-containing protein
VTGGIPTYTFSVDGLPAEGNASITGSSLTYTADDDAALGDDAFTVQVLDSGVTQHTASIPVTITIAAEPLPLTAGTVTITANPGETVNGDLRTSVSGGVPPYTFGLGDQGSQGTATVNEDGTFTYTANDGATGTDSFTYTETDSEQVLTTIDAAATTTGTVNVTIIAPDATATVTPTVTPTTDPTATPSPTSSTSTGTVLPGRPGSNATQTPASDDDADGNGSDNEGVTQLPNTGTGANDDSSLALLGLAGAAALLLASLVAYRRRQA